MKKFFLIPLLTLMCSVMAWGADKTLAPGGDFTSTVAQAGANGTITLTGNVTATPQSPQTPYVMVMPNFSPITINLAGYTLDFSSCPLMQMMSTVNFTGAGEVTGMVSFMNSGNNLNFAAGFTGTANITMSSNSGGTINIQGTSGHYSESIKNFLSLTLPSGKKLAKLHDCDTYYSVVDNAYETQSCSVAEPVAQIGETQYTSLVEAFNQLIAFSEDGTIQLVADATIDYKLLEHDEDGFIVDGAVEMIDSEITLDLNGHNLYADLAGTQSLFSIWGGSLTIEGSGEVTLVSTIWDNTNDVPFGDPVAVDDFSRLADVTVGYVALQGGSYWIEPTAEFVPECYQVDEVSSRYVVSATPGCETLKTFLEKEGTASLTLSADYDISDKGVIYVNGNKTLTIAEGVTLYYKRQALDAANIIVNSGATLNVLGNGTMRPVANADPESEDNIWHNVYLSRKAQYDATTDKDQKKAIGAQMQGWYDGNRAIDVNGTLIVGVKDDANNCPHFVTTSISRGAAVMVNAGGEATFNNANIDAANMAIKNYGTTTINSGRYVSSSSYKNGVCGDWYSYHINTEGILTINGGDFIGVQGAVAVYSGGIAYIYGGNYETVYGVNHLTGEPNTKDNHYALYVATMATVDVHGGNFKVQTPSSGGNQVILIGDNDAGTTFGIINFYGGTFQQKPYLSHRKAQDAEMIYPAGIPTTSQWYSSFGTNVPLPAGYEYYEIIASGEPEGKQVVDAVAYAAGYRYKVICENENTKEVVVDDPEATIPWQQNTTWDPFADPSATGIVPEKTTIVTIPKNATVVVKSDPNMDPNAVAEQVFVSQGATLTVETGTTLKIGEGGVNISNGGQIVVEPDAIVTVGDAGIVTTEDEAIIIEASEQEQGVLLLNPAVTENTRPKATVKLVTKAKQIAENDFIYERFAIPTIDGSATRYSNEGLDTVHYYNAGTELLEGLYEWSDAAKDWVGVSSWKNLQPFTGYQLTNNSQYGNVVYTFEGNLVGNHNESYNFAQAGFGFFGNSYTGAIDIKNFLESFGGDMQKSIWIYDYFTDGFKIVTEDNYGTVKYGSRRNPQGFITEIRSMQAFIMNKATAGSQAVDYSNAIWGNPKYGLVEVPAGAPAKRVAEDADHMTVYVFSGNKEDEVTLIRSNEYSNEFDNGADASKWMNKSMNLYIAGEENLAILASDNIDNTTIAFQSGKETEYTIGFADLRGEEYILRDVLTGAMIQMVEGAEYTFTQEANTTVPARFQVIAPARIPTGVENVENAPVMQKVMLNGTLYILRDNKWYSVQGQNVK